MPTPYGYIKRSKFDVVVDSFPKSNGYNLYFLNTFTESKQALWVVSNCFTQNKRHEIVTELQNYVEVDIYGKCGKGQISIDLMKHMMESVYKFYLAFENSNCPDYITEKFYNSLEYDFDLPLQLLF